MCVYTPVCCGCCVFLFGSFAIALRFPHSDKIIFQASSISDGASVSRADRTKEPKFTTGHLQTSFLGHYGGFNSLLNTTRRRASRKRSPIPNHEGPCQPWGASALTHGRTVVAHSVVGVGFVWKNMLRSKYCKKLVVVGLSAFTWDQLGRGGAAMHQNPRAS